MQYRADIDGLRTIAVLAVVLFHLDVSGFSGGFVGVDVFFVISGYLITSIIVGKIDRGTFGLGDFYGRRVRRLFPPLIATVAATFLAASIIVAPYDFIALGRSAVAALFSVSNVVFFSEAGYWDTASELKPLLHTWSLGVEEQFYLVWPAMLLWYLHKPRRVGLGSLLLAIFLLGYLACGWWTARDASAAFYLLPFRAFEFAMGAGVICIARWELFRRVARLPLAADGMALLGLGLVAWSVYSFGEDTLFPGWSVIVPTTGSVLLLLSGAGPTGSGPLGRTLLSNQVSVWGGRVSYSMYLVHWPIIALYRYQASSSELLWHEQIALGMLTLLATFVLHYGVERQFYQRALGESGNGPQRSGSRSAIAILVVSAGLALLPLSAWLGDGWSWRRPDLVLSVAQVEKGMKERFKLLGDACSVIGWGSSEQCDPEKPHQVLIFGNSLEVDAYNFLFPSYGTASDINLILFRSTNNCPNLHGKNGAYTSTDDYCSRRFAGLFREELVSRLDTIVYSAGRPFSSDQQTHLNVIRDLMSRNPGIKLVTLGGYLINVEPCWRLINESGASAICAAAEHVEYFGDDPSRWKLYHQFMELTDLFVDRVSLLCPARKLENCATETPDGVLMSYDRHHMSFEFAEYSGKLYERRYPNFLRKLVLEEVNATRDEAVD